MSRFTHYTTDRVAKFRAAFSASAGEDNNLSAMELDTVWAALELPPTGEEEKLERVLDPECTGTITMDDFFKWYTGAVFRQINTWGVLQGKAIEGADTDGDEKLSQEEFETKMNEIYNKPPVSQITAYLTEKVAKVRSEFSHRGGETIPVKDLGDILWELDYKPDDEEQGVMMDKLDSEGSGTITLDNFFKWYTGVHFKEMDRYDSGHISGFVAYKCMGDKSVGMRDKRADMLKFKEEMGVVDTDGDGKISKEEFENKMNEIFNKTAA